MKEGFKTIIEILKNADSSTYYKGYMHEVIRDKDFYCSLGIVAKELGYDERYGQAYFLHEKLKLDTDDLRLVTELNDNQCESYQCVANELETKLIETESK